jgi:hypothetical protein
MLDSAIAQVDRRWFLTDDTQFQAQVRLAVDEVALEPAVPRFSPLLHYHQPPPMKCVLGLTNQRIIAPSVLI